MDARTVHLHPVGAEGGQVSDSLVDASGKTLAEFKRFVDRLFLSGVNHVFYHGCCYSPVEAPWPGWCFYASSEMNWRNSIWRDVKFLNAYIVRARHDMVDGSDDGRGSPGRGNDRIGTLRERVHGRKGKWPAESFSDKRRGRRCCRCATAACSDLLKCLYAIYVNDCIEKL